MLGWLWAGRIWQSCPSIANSMPTAYWACQGNIVKCESIARIFLRRLLLRKGRRIPAWLFVGCSRCISVLVLGFGVVHAQDNPQRRGRKYKVPEDTSHMYGAGAERAERQADPERRGRLPPREGRQGRRQPGSEDERRRQGDHRRDPYRLDGGRAGDCGRLRDVRGAVRGEGSRARDRGQDDSSARADFDVSEQRAARHRSGRSGVQEPKKPSTPPVVQAPQPTNHTSDPNPIAPVDPNATPGNSQNNQTIPPKTWRAAAVMDKPLSGKDRAGDRWGEADWAGDRAGAWRSGRGCCDYVSGLGGRRCGQPVRLLVALGVRASACTGAIWRSRLRSRETVAGRLRRAARSDWTCW